MRLFQFHFSNNITGNVAKCFVRVAHNAIKYYRQKNYKVEVADARKSYRTQISPFFDNDPYIYILDGDFFFVEGL